MPRVAGAFLFVVFGVAACGRPIPLSPHPLEAERSGVLREGVRRLALSNCTPCHVGSSPDHKARAVAVFDLEEPDWTARMKDGQLPAFAGRIMGKLSPEQATDVRAFLEGELARRSSVSRGP